MATLTRFDDRVIAFRKIANERVGSLFLMAGGFFFTCMGFVWLPLRETWGPHLLLFIPVGLFGSSLIAFTLVPLFKSERLVIDLDRRKYKCRRGVLFWGERLKGPLTDFDQIRLTFVPDPGRDPYWAVEIAWRDDRHPPFRVHNWKRHDPRVRTSPVTTTSSFYS